MTRIAPVSPPESASRRAMARRAALVNKLRAAVLGANDGIVSTASLVMGVAGATTNTWAILVAGIAALSAGALSMAAGEYVSVSAQRDSDRALLERTRQNLAQDPAAGLIRLAARYQEKGLSPELADQVAVQLTEYEPLAAHAEADLGVDPTELVSPWAAAGASLGAFTLGALIPLLTMVLTPPDLRVVATVAATTIALSATGYLSARAGDSSARTAVIRVVLGGLLAMGITYAVGSLVGVGLG
ncbi:MAG: VIT family protein [Propioniciclava sp.]